MAKMKKEQQQVVMLSVVLGLIGAVLLYFYWDKLLPRPEGEEQLAAEARLAVPSMKGTCQDDKTACTADADCQKVGGTAKCTDALFKRSDFHSLKAFGDVPVRALPGSGSPDPFQNDQKQ